MKEERAMGRLLLGHARPDSPTAFSKPMAVQLHSLWLDDERQWQRHRSGEKGYCTTAELHYFVVRT